MGKPDALKETPTLTLNLLGALEETQELRDPKMRGTQVNNICHSRLHPTPGTPWSTPGAQRITVETPSLDRTAQNSPHEAWGFRDYPHAHLKTWSQCHRGTRYLKGRFEVQD